MLVPETAVAGRGWTEGLVVEGSGDIGEGVVGGRFVCGLFVHNSRKN